MIPVFNGEATITRALASLLIQTVESWEAVIVDDGSTDRTAEVVGEIADPRIRLFRFGTNRGRGAARQFALENCRGKFLAMVDADDWWYPWKLERQLGFLEVNGDIGVVSSAMASAGGGGTIRGVWKPARATQGVKKVHPLCNLSTRLVPHAPCLMRMELAASVGYDCRLRRSEDFVFLARVLRQSSQAVLPDVLYAYNDTESFSREGAFWRYAWSARASLHLCKEFGAEAVVRSGRNLLQIVSAVLGVNWGQLSHSSLREPTPEEAQEFDRAWREVESARQGFGT